MVCFLEGIAGGIIGFWIVVLGCHVYVKIRR